MKRIIFLTVILFLRTGFAVTDAETVRDQITKKMKHAPGKTNDYSIFVINGDGPIFGLHENVKRVPASLSKIPTAATVLRNITVTKKFLTQISTDVPVSKISKGELKGNLYVIGGGDPAFVSETMWVLVNNLTRSGIKSVSGDIVVDDSWFDQEYIADTREDMRVDRAYDAPVSAMSFNWNSVNVCVRPGDTSGSEAKVVLDPPNKYVQLKNSAKTSSSDGKMNIKVERKPVDPIGDLLVVSGSIPEGHDEKVIYKNISSPPLWTGYNLIEFLSQRGIRVEGGIKTGKAPVNAEVLATAESWPLANIVADLMKFSNNYVAEMLTKHLSSPSPGKPGNLKGGIEKIKEFMVDAGLKKSDFNFESPSGFTRNNQITAQDLAKLLVYIRKDFRIFPEFLSSLPIAGQDGTLKSRMNSPNMQGWVRAKTGMLNGTIGLAGYAGRKNGQILTFVFLYNGSGDVYKVRDFFDSLAEGLVL